jgi:hypothetical protein
MVVEVLMPGRPIQEFLADAHLSVSSEQLTSFVLANR